MADKTDLLPNWGYEGNIGPSHWGELSPAYAMAKLGKKQSPIDIPSSAPLNPPDLVFDYKPGALQLVNTGQTIQANCNVGSYLKVDGMLYRLVQYHFHNPSESTLDGQATPMEIHLVHMNGQGEIAVVGGFMVEGPQSKAYAPIFDNMPSETGDPVDVEDVMVNPVDLLPVERTYWRYDGSLTTPPCSEGVKWFMLKQPIEVSAKQIAMFKALYTGNARPVQPMNGRKFIVGQQQNDTNDLIMGYPRPLAIMAMVVVSVAASMIAHLIFHGYGDNKAGKTSSESAAR